MVAVSNPATVGGLVRLAAWLSRPGDEFVVVRIVPVSKDASLEEAQREAVLARRFQDVLKRAERCGREAGAQVETVLRAAHDVASGIAGEAASRERVHLLVLGWRGPSDEGRRSTDICRDVLRKAPCDVAVFLNRGPVRAEHILVPMGGGRHARRGLRLAAGLAARHGAKMTVLRVDSARVHDPALAKAAVEQVLRDELGDDAGKLPVAARVVQAATVVQGIREEAQHGYDLLIIGASEEGFLRNWLFGSIPDTIADDVPCSVLLVREYEPLSVSRLRRALTLIFGRHPGYQHES
jgi:CIC family chloride channel protein